MKPEPMLTKQQSFSSAASTSVSTSSSSMQYRPASGGVSSAATGPRALGRGAPMFAAPRMENAWGSDSFGPASRPLGSTVSSSRPAAGGVLAEALREKDRRVLSHLDATVYDPAQDQATQQQDTQVRASYATPYDPGVDSRSLKADNARDATAHLSERTMSHSSLEAVSHQGGPPASATSGSGDAMPIAPMAGPVHVQDPRAAELAASALDLSDLRRFLTSPVPKGAGVVQCYIDRDKSSISSMLYPMYTLSYKERFLLAGKKRTYNKTSNYMITMDKRDLNRESPAFLGKLRSNMVGTEYVVFDDGEAMDSKPVPSSGSTELRQVSSAACTVLVHVAPSALISHPVPSPSHARRSWELCATPAMSSVHGDHAR